MSTKLLHQIQAQDQTELAERHNGSRKRIHRSRWVIDTLHDRLPPEHIQLARHLFDQQAIAEGLKPRDYDRIDRSGNSAESAILSRLEAQLVITGYEASVRQVLDVGGARCFRAIVEGDTLAETMRRCGYGGKADRSTTQLVQLVMLQASDYRDYCTDQRSRGRGLAA